MKNMEYRAVGLTLKVEDKRNDDYYKDIVYNASLNVEVSNGVMETPLGNIPLEKQIMNVPLNEEETRMLKDIFLKAKKRISKEKEIVITNKSRKF